MIELQFDSVIFLEGKTFIAYSPKLDISSCGNSMEEARKKKIKPLKTTDYK